MAVRHKDLETLSKVHRDEIRRAWGGIIDINIFTQDLGGCGRPGGFKEKISRPGFGYMGRLGV